MPLLLIGLTGVGLGGLLGFTASDGVKETSNLMKWTVIGAAGFAAWYYFLRK